jgi:protein-arginine deiminase
VVNLLTFEDQALVPRTFGPVVDGQDVFEQVTRQRLEALGLVVRFVDVWDLYHRLEGEVHCGSNVDRTMPEGASWWVTTR